MIYVITGKNDFLRTESLKQKISDFSKKHGELSIEKISSDKADYKSIISAISSLPFLVDRKMIILEEPGQIKEFAEAIDEVFGLVSDNIDVLIYEPRIDKRSSYYKSLKKIKNFTEYSELRPNEISRWAEQYVKQNNGKISSANAFKIVDRVGSNQMLIKNEIDKLLLYGQEISTDTIEGMTDQIPRSTIFQLLDNSLRGNKRAVIEIYEQQKKLKVEAMQIMSLLIWQLHILAIIKTSQSTSTNEIVSLTGLSPFSVENGLKLLRQINFAQLSSIIDRTLELDIKMKTVAINPDESLMVLLLTIN
ncbi:MAG: DNA polymerase III subunit delta [Candidatus Saccharibacteria bacterium]